MKVISTNIGTPKSFIRNGKEELTGIFKQPILEPLFLETQQVTNDTVIDRVHHAGINKACYLFASNNYPYWKNLYPNLDWNWGMFGENLTIENLDEYSMRIGDIYKIGNALVQVSQPREPCFKLGVRFDNQAVLKQFIDHNRPGTYVRVLEPGSVKTGDAVVLVAQSKNTLTVQQFYALLYAKEKPKNILDLFMSNTSVPQYKKDKYLKYM